MVKSCLCKTLTRYKCCNGTFISYDQITNKVISLAARDVCFLRLIYKVVRQEERNLSTVKTNY